MQWVVTTGDTVAEAKAHALDALGIDESDLEYEVLSEPGTRLFGLRKVEARVRARVRPTRPRPKVDRRNRRAPRPGEKRRRPRSKKAAGAAPTPDDETSRGPVPPSQDRPGHDRASTGRSSSDRASTGAEPTSEAEQASPAKGTRGAPDMSDIPLSTQEPTALDFVRGLVDAFGADAEVSAHDDADDDAIEIHVEGDDLGLLVGPRGTTLSAIAELTRTAVAQQHAGRLEGRLRVDVAGYRARRKEALIRFAGQVAEKVLDTGEPVALEPMSPPDRKAVHDAINEIDGVRTTSRGEDRGRHVVILPDD